jgi:hypothetical protein
LADYLFPALPADCGEGYCIWHPLWYAPRQATRGLYPFIFANGYPRLGKSDLLTGEKQVCAMRQRQPTAVRRVITTFTQQRQQSLLVRYQQVHRAGKNLFNLPRPPESEKRAICG